MDSADEMHAREREYWNGFGGEKWVRNQGRTDAVLAPMAALALDHTAVASNERVVDVGCGCGVTTIALGERVGPEGKVLGLDISEPMIAVASHRVPEGLPVRFVAGDAATHPFEAGAYDMLFSRFGVMFFGNPAAAFANLRKALRPGGRVRFACWRPASENPWMIVPLQAAYAHVPALPTPNQDDPGPFSFGNPVRVRGILDAAGYADIAFRTGDLGLDLASGGGLEAAVDFSLEIGATSRAVKDQPEDVVQAVRGAVRDVLAPYAHANGAVTLQAAIWLVSATNP